MALLRSCPEVLLCSIFVIITVVVYGDVVINRCCTNDTILDGSGECVRTESSMSTWAPVVYFPSKQTLLDLGTIPVDWKYKENTRPKCSEGIEPTQFPPDSTTQSVVMFDNGSLVLSEHHPPLIVNPGKYCIDPAGSVVCVEDRPDLHGPVSSTRPKVRECCGRNAVYSEASQSCKVWLEKDSILPIANVTLVPDFPDCDEQGRYAISGKLDDTHKLLENGELQFGGKIMSKFCIERVFERPDDGPTVFTCVEKHGPQRNDIRFTLYPMGLFLSVFFLAVTLIASCLLPSTYHVLHWRCQTNHVACLLIGDLLLAITQLSGGALDGPACVAIAITMHFIFLAAFFWLNTMCFNIWWTFRDLRPASLDKGQEVCRLRFYELYAWGGPLLIAGVGAIMDHLPEDSHPNLLKPRFGQQRCWFYGDVEVFYYFYGPVGILLLLNLTLFAATARELTCGLWKTEVVKSNTERATLGRVCLKLVVVMGITWVADVVSWLVGGPAYVWYFTDLINALQGVLIFAVVGCQPQVWAAVKRLWCLREVPSEGNNVRSSSSHAMPSVGDHNTSTTTTKALETLC